MDKRELFEIRKKIQINKPSGIHLDLVKGFELRRVTAKGLLVILNKSFHIHQTTVKP